MIHVIAIITAKPGCRGKLLEAFRANTAAVRAESGCIEYGATVDVDNLAPSFAAFGPDTYVVLEKWESLAAVEAHASAPHILANRVKTKDWVASRVIHVLHSAT